jgi:hypothetical protein
MLLSSVISRVDSALAGLPDPASAEMLQRANQEDVPYQPHPSKTTTSGALSYYYVASRGTNHPDADRPGDIRTASGANSVPRGALTPTAVPLSLNPRSDHNLWGVTVDNRYFVWRSGVGITADGNIVYAMGLALSARCPCAPSPNCCTVRARCGRWSSTSTPSGSRS